jgi:hypothetical protein
VNDIGVIDDVPELVAAVEVSSFTKFDQMITND